MNKESYSYAMADLNGQIFQITTGPYLYIECDETVSDDTHYIDVSTGEIKEKLTLTLNKTIEGLTVTIFGLPAGLTAATNSMETVTDGEPLVVEYDIPGNYTITLTGRVEYMDHELEVTVG